MMNQLTLDIIGNTADIGVFSILGNEKLNEAVFKENQYYSKNVLLLIVGLTFIGNLSVIVKQRCDNPELFKDNFATNCFQAVCCTVAATAISLIELRDTYFNTIIGLEDDSLAGILFLSSLIGSLALNLYIFKNEASLCDESRRYDRITTIGEDVALYSQLSHLQPLFKVGFNVLKLVNAIVAVQQAFLSSSPEETLKTISCYSTVAFSGASASLACFMRNRVNHVSLNDSYTDESTKHDNQDDGPNHFSSLIPSMV